MRELDANDLAGNTCMFCQGWVGLESGHVEICDSCHEEQAAKGKQYLGDGVYVEYDGARYVLTTLNGRAVTSEIFLEPEVYEALTRFVSAIEKLEKESKK